MSHAITSWGRVVRKAHRVVAPAWMDELKGLIANAKKPLLAGGLRRSYGDSGLNPEGTLLVMTGLDKILHFDRKTGILRAEAGASLFDLIPVVTRAGWFFSTTPGTRFVTLGGAVAHDVHGKNHGKAGSFGCGVRRLGMISSSGVAKEVAPGDALFEATVGGMGLTGVIAWVEVQLVKIPSVNVVVERIAFRSLAEFWELAETSKQEHTVAWLDAMDADGRGVFERADWVKMGGFELPTERVKTFPFTPPVTPLNKVSVWLFNQLYFWKTPHGAKVEALTKFFYPLDGIRHWNRLYGPRGFYQYQCALPKATMKLALPKMLAVIAASGQASFLSTLKTLGGKASGGMMSFPLEGCTLALDFPNRGASTLALFSALDDLVEEAGGRLYAAKDGRMDAGMVEAGYPRLQEFVRFVDKGICSHFWARIGFKD